MRSCCPKTEAILAEKGSDQLKERYLRIITLIENFYEYEYRGCWGSNYEYEADLLGVLDMVCWEIEQLGD